MLKNKIKLSLCLVGALSIFLSPSFAGDEGQHHVISMGEDPSSLRQRPVNPTETNEVQEMPVVPAQVDQIQQAQNLFKDMLALPQQVLSHPVPLIPGRNSADQPCVGTIAGIGLIGLWNMLERLQQCNYGPYASDELTELALGFNCNEVAVSSLLTGMGLMYASSATSPYIKYLMSAWSGDKILLFLAAASAIVSKATFNNIASEIGMPILGAIAIGYFAFDLRRGTLLKHFGAAIAGFALSTCYYIIMNGIRAYNRGY